MALVLKKDAKKAQKLNDFLKICDKKQSEALDAHNEKEFYIWVKEARLARRELTAMYRAKEKHDIERERDRKNILGVIQKLRSQGVDASVVERAHYITLAN